MRLRLISYCLFLLFGFAMVPPLLFGFFKFADSRNATSFVLVFLMCKRASARYSQRLDTVDICLYGRRISDISIAVSFTKERFIDEYAFINNMRPESIGSADVDYSSFAFVTVRIYFFPKMVAPMVYHDLVWREASPHPSPVQIFACSSSA